MKKKRNLHLEYARDSFFKNFFCLFALLLFPAPWLKQFQTTSGSTGRRGCEQPRERRGCRAAMGPGPAEPLVLAGSRRSKELL